MKVTLKCFITTDFNHPDITTTTLSTHLQIEHTMAHQNRLVNTHVLVLGGTSGIGFAVANLALSSGARVTISGSRQPKVDDKVAKLRSFYPNLPASNVAGHACDLLDKENMEANLQALLDNVTEHGSKQINHIAITAGDLGVLPKVQDVTIESALSGLTTRFLAPALLIKILSAGKYMPLTAESSITLTGGTNTSKPLPGWSYGASWGGAVEGYVRGLAVDMTPLRVNLVIPGAIQTELLQGYLDNVGEEGGRKMRNGVSLTDSFGQPEDIAEAYGYLMKDRFATGAFVTSDGGRLLASPNVE
jgi:NAD(P)-dependent dehydrogenase (short-subunit alcohol dehydrogenase family)